MNHKRNESGEGCVEYVLIIAMVALAILIAMYAVAAGANPAEMPQPPAIDAPMLEIVRWCESHARERKTRLYMAPVMVGKTMTMQSRTQVSYVDAPDEFVRCMQGYEYRVSR